MGNEINFKNKINSQKIGLFFHDLVRKDGFKAIVAGLSSIIIGLFAGFIVMLIVSPESSLAGLKTLFTTGFSSETLFSRVIYNTIPMIFSGLGIAFAFKLGLFNIGITGQVTIGAFTSLIVGLNGGHWLVCLLVGAISGAIAGFIPGFLKAKFNVNEVLSGIILNWVIYYIIGIIGNMALPTSFKDKTTPSELRVMPNNGLMPSLGIEGMEAISVGLIFALFAVIIVFIVLNYTTFGFELKMTGRNKNASQYAGVNQTKSTILALTICGALGGICGYMLYATPNNPVRFMWDSSSNTLLTDGFNGISVALIAQNSPFGCILAGIFINLIDISKNALKTVSNGAYNIHYTELIKSIIIYVAALSSFFNILLTKINNRTDLKLNFSRDDNLKKEDK